MLDCSCTAVAVFFFFNDTATTEIYTLSLHDALPIFTNLPVTQLIGQRVEPTVSLTLCTLVVAILIDRKSTRLNSSHQIISYAVFCLKKKKKTQKKTSPTTKQPTISLQPMKSPSTTNT